MSFLAEFKIEDECIKILECTFDFSQNVGSDGRTVGRPQAGLIHLLLESTKNTDILSWMVKEDTYKDGEIVFYNRDSLSSNKTLTFQDGICVSYHETFSAVDTLPMKTRIAISARIIEINGVKHENSWKVY